MGITSTPSIDDQHLRDRITQARNRAIEQKKVIDEMYNCSRWIPCCPCYSDMCDERYRIDREYLDDIINILKTDNRYQLETNRIERLCKNANITIGDIESLIRYVNAILPSHLHPE